MNSIVVPLGMETMGMVILGMDMEGTPIKDHVILLLIDIKVVMVTAEEGIMVTLVIMVTLEIMVTLVIMVTLETMVILGTTRDPTMVLEKSVMVSTKAMGIGMVLQVVKGVWIKIVVSMGIPTMVAQIMVIVKMVPTMVKDIVKGTMDLVALRKVK